MSSPALRNGLRRRFWDGLKNDWQEYADVVASPLAALGGPWLLHCIFLIT
jgi:hypothetical protein